MTTSRTYFNETWLSESPQRIPKKKYFEILLFALRDFIAMGKKPIDIGNNIKKLEMEQVLIYWYESNGIIQLILELDKKPQGLMVNLLGKDETLKGVPPFASDLYNAVLKDRKTNIRITSDNLLTDEGYNIWKRLYNQGHTISVYNSDNPGQSFVTLFNINDFDEYFGDEESYKKYQFVLVENSFLVETRCYFNTRKIRESFGYNLED